MHVIFVEPVFPGNQRRFPYALKEAGAKVSAIGAALRSGLVHTLVTDSATARAVLAEEADREGEVVLDLDHLSPPAPGPRGRSPRSR